MASLKRDTPAGRAALARRRQRAAAVVDHSARFVHPEDEGAVGASEDSTLSDRDREHTPQLQQQPPPPPPPPPKQQPSRPSTSTRPHPVDPPPQKKPPPRARQKDPPPRAAPNAASFTSYSTASLPSSDELLERSSQVAQTAASVLASARKTKQSGRTVTEPGWTQQQQQQQPYETPMARKPDVTTETPVAAPFVSSKLTPLSPALAERRVHQQQQQRLLQQQQQQASASKTPQRGVMEQDPPSNDHNNYQNNQHVVDEEDTLEELEPVISRQNEYEVLDAACLRSGSWIMLRSMATSATVVSTQENTSTGDSMALVGGNGLSGPEEVVQLLLSSDNSDNNNITIQRQQGINDEPAMVRWGDSVVLLLNQFNSASLQHPKTLGVRKRNGGQHGGIPTDGKVGWILSPPEEVETWTVLRGDDGSKHGVRVGLAALPAAKIIAERRAARGECTRVVQSGDPVLLRNDRTGGLLSVDMADGSLELVTDSYDSNRGDAFLAGSNTTRGLLGQLQQHSRYIPQDQATFSLIQACVPPCPRWILGGGTSTSCNQQYNPHGHRMYLHQTYLTHSKRNTVNPRLHEKLFGDNWASLASSNQHDDSRDGIELTDQESILLDEVLGVSLGLEGKRIRANVRGGGQDQTNGLSMGTPQNIEFQLSHESVGMFDASLRSIADRILPLGTSYAHVSAFVASHLPGYEYGSVMQAFCEALDRMLQEYASFIGALEQQFRQPQTAENLLTLRRLHTHLMPSLLTMSVLERATFAARDKIGGALINSLSTLKSWSCEGDLVANRVLSILLDKCSIPYMTMLTLWLQKGQLRDPYNEFMIEIGDKTTDGSQAPMKHQADADYNDEIYILREEHVLTELCGSETLLQKVIAAGKYWRAVRSCGVAPREDEQALGQSQAVLQYSLSFNVISSFIQSMYEGASQTLVAFLMKDFNLMRALRTMKQYFLLDHGDFLQHFLDSAEDELLKELGDVSTGRIQHWLRRSVQLTDLGVGENSPGSGSKSNNGQSRGPSLQRKLSPLALRCRFQPIGLISHIDSISLSREGILGSADDSVLETSAGDAYGISNKSLTGVETFMLDFPSVPFPISLVLEEKALSSYQLLFRLLFFAKYVERRLLKVWLDHQAMKELNSVRGLFGPTFLLRQRMLHFAQNLIYYFMFEVIEPNWLEMEIAIGNSKTPNQRTVDDIVEVHESFLNRSLEACLLTNKELVRTLTKLMTTCLMFADQMKLFTEATRIHDESSRIAAERRKAIQRSLNDRGGGASKESVALREALHSFKQDRATRLKKQKRRVGRELSSESYRRMVGRFEEVFSAYLSEFMLQLNSDGGGAYQDYKTNLSTRLDYNGFLSSSIMTGNSRIN